MLDGVEHMREQLVTPAANRGGHRHSDRARGECHDHTAAPTSEADDAPDVSDKGSLLNDGVVVRAFSIIL